MLQRTMPRIIQNSPEKFGPVPADQVDDECLAPHTQVFRSKVYPADDGESWIVEPPRDQTSSVSKMTFSGLRGQQRALTHAFETFGNARFFPYQTDGR